MYRVEFTFTDTNRHDASNDVHCATMDEVEDAIDAFADEWESFSCVILQVVERREKSTHRLPAKR